MPVFIVITDPFDPLIHFWPQRYAIKARPPSWVEGRAGNLSGGALSLPVPVVPTI